MAEYLGSNQPRQRTTLGATELRAYNPSLRERLGGHLYDIARNAGYTDARTRSRQWGQLLDFIPGIGEAMGLQDTKRNYDTGNYLGAAVGGAATLAGMLPVGGDALGTGLRKMRGKFDLDYFGTPIKIMGNPSKNDIAGMVNRSKYKALRRITDPDTGDVYVWDADAPALHGLVAEQLGIRYDENFADMLFGD